MIKLHLILHQDDIHEKTRILVHRFEEIGKIKIVRMITAVSAVGQRAEMLMW